MRKYILITYLLLASVMGYGQCPDIQIILNTQQRVDDFASTYPNCTELKRTLIVGNQISNTDITNLNGISMLTAVGVSNGGLGGYLAFWNAPLESLAGMENLEFIGGQLFVRNTNVPNLSGLSSLSTIRGGITIWSNPNIVNLEGLPTKVFFEGGLYIYSNAELVNFQGLNIVDEGVGYGREVIIDNNPSLQNLSGLEGLETTAKFQILNNDNIISLDAVTSLSVIFESTTLTIAGNVSLSDCAIQMVCDALDDSSVQKVIQNNASGCNSQQEVEAACLLSISDESIEDKVGVYPNPVSDILQIRVSDGVVFENVTVYSILGEQLFFTSEETIDCTQLSSGIYFVRVSTDRGSVTKKIIKN